MQNIFEWMLASLVGAFGATATQPANRQRRRASLRRGQSLSQYVSAILLVTFVRHLWQNTESRRLLVWSNRLGPCLKGMLGQVLQSALQILSQAKDTVDMLSLLEPHEQPSPAAERVEQALARLAAKRPLLGPEVAPECWESHIGPNGQTFWHCRALGPAPWSMDIQAASQESRVQLCDQPLCAPEIAPECWESHVGPHGQVFWHNRALGPAPWSKERQSILREGEVVDICDSDSRGLKRMDSKSLPPNLRPLLANWGLNQYAAPLEACGYTAEDLTKLDASATDKMLKAISCAEGDREVFHKALESWSQ